MKRFKVGDKVKIPKTKKGFCNIDFNRFIEEINKKQYPYLVISHVHVGHDFYHLKGPNNANLEWVVFYEEDLELYEEQVMKDKKIIGYKLKKGFERYEKAILAISGLNAFNGGTTFSKGSIIYERLEVAGVLNLWFDPIFEDERIFINNHEVTKEKDSFGVYYKIGCKTVRFDYLKDTKEFMEKNNFNKISFDDIEVKLETINKILNL